MNIYQTFPGFKPVSYPFRLCFSKLSSETFSIRSAGVSCLIYSIQLRCSGNLSRFHRSGLLSCPSSHTHYSCASIGSWRQIPGHSPYQSRPQLAVKFVTSDEFGLLSQSLIILAVFSSYAPLCLKSVFALSESICRLYISAKCSIIFDQICCVSRNSR